MLEKLRTLDTITDVNTDREQTGLQVNVNIDREAAARLGVEISDVGAALNDAFAQRQIATSYTERNQYRVIFEVEPQFSTAPDALGRIYVTANDGTQVPLTAVTRRTLGTAPLSVAHQGQFPAATISFNLAPDVILADAPRASSARSPSCICPTRSPRASPATPAPSASRRAARSC